MVKVVKEPGDAFKELSLEKCCFCRNPTQFWTVGDDGKVGLNSVACCGVCATSAMPKDIPTKAQWIRRERIASGRANTV